MNFTQKSETKELLQNEQIVKDHNARQKLLLRLCIETRLRNAFFDSKTIRDRIFELANLRKNDPFCQLSNQEIEFQSKLIRLYNENEFRFAYPEVFEYWQESQQVLEKKFKDNPYRERDRISDLLVFAGYLLSNVAIDYNLNENSRTIIIDMIRYRMSSYRSLQRKKEFTKKASEFFFSKISIGNTDKLWINPTLVIEPFCLDLATVGTSNPRILPNKYKEFFGFYFPHLDHFQVEVIQFTEQEANILSKPYILKENIEKETVDDLKECGVIV